MPSIQIGQSSSAATPILDIWTAVGNPQYLLDVAVLQFRIWDTSTDPKKVNPVQVYPSNGWQSVDPTTASPSGVRLGVGHYFAPYTVSLNEPIGDHRIDWQFRQTVSSPWEAFSEDFYVTPNPGAGPDPSNYCSVADIRAEGFTDPTLYPDARIINLIALWSRFVDKACGRWFYPKEFPLATLPNGFVKTVNLLPGTQYPTPTQANLVSGDNPLRVDGNEARGLVTCELEIPICRIDAVGIESQAFLSTQLTWIELASIRVYNRHLLGMTEPDDRESPKIGFTVTGRIFDVVAAGLFPPPRIFPAGRLNVFLFGAFGFTDADPANVVKEGITPPLIRQATKLLVIRDLLPESKRTQKIPFQNTYRIIQDQEGSTSVGLQQMWLKGGFTGDPAIDSLLSMYRRPPRFGAV